MVFTENDYDNQHTAFAGIDVNWFATDTAGQIGYFTSAGSGPVPDCVITGRATLADIYDAIARLPTTYSPRIDFKSGLLGEIAPGFEDVAVDYSERLISMGKRGVFCFDASNSGEPGYRRLVRPHRPLVIGQADHYLQQELSKYQLPCVFSLAECLI